MSEPYVIFANKGLIDPRSIKTFGVSVKEGSNPIGFFGTGLKYALAIYMRLGHEVTIHSGKEVYKIESKSGEIRGKGFDFVTMNGEDLPFTTELGKTWEPWQAFREIYCNCLDEGGKVTTSDLLPLVGDGVTRIIVRGEEATKSFFDRSSIVLDLSKELLVRADGIEIYNVPSHYLYYRGVRVHKLTKKSILTYNIIDPTELTEDRTLKNLSHVSCSIPTFLCGIRNKNILKKVLTADDDTYEGRMAYDWLDFHKERVSEEFMQVLEAEYKANSELVNNSARRYFMKTMELNAAKYYEPEEMTPVERMQIEKCVRIMNQLYRDFKEIEIMSVKSLGQTTMALADIDKRAIVISKDCFRLGTKYLLATILEEYAHLKSGHSDLTRPFQTYIFDMMTSLIEEHIVKEPV